jgi:hypothetical protein
MHNNKKAANALAAFFVITVYSEKIFILINRKYQ